MKIIHERADGTIVSTMSGVKAPSKATAVLQCVTFAEILRREEHYLEESTNRNTGNSSNDVSTSSSR